MKPRVLFFRQWLQRQASVVVVVSAALLLVSVLGIVFWRAQDMLEDELEKRAESGMMIKSVIIKGVLNRVECVLENHVWDAQRSLNEPDSMYHVVDRLLDVNSNIVGGGMAFVPGYYPQLDSLFEPCATRRDTLRVTDQIANDEHDYTQLPFYRNAVNADSIYWADPYMGGGLDELITTCSRSVQDASGRTAGVLGVDVSLDWLSDTLNLRHIYPSSFTLLLNENGQVISKPHAHHTNPSRVEQVLQLIADSTLTWLPTKSGNNHFLEFREKDTGEEGIIFKSYMKGHPRFQILTVCYDREVFGKFNWQGIYMALLLLVAFGVLLFIIHRFAKNEQKLHQATIDQERMGSELRIAKNIQMEMLPEQYPPYPERNDIGIFGAQLAAKEVGGDIYDFYIRDEKLFFCIGDVSGKGIPSALVMAVTHALFRTASAHENNPGRIMQAINETSCSGNKSNMFVTLFLGVLDLPTGRLRYCNAGHDAPIILQLSSLPQLPLYRRGQGGGFSTLNTQPNLPVGIIDDFKYECMESSLPAGATLFLYTDGLTEAKNRQHQLFQLERVQDVLEEALQEADIDPEPLLRRMQGAVDRFVKDAEQSDDLTMLAIRYTPQTEQAIINETLELTRQVSDVARLNSFVAGVTDRLQLEASLGKRIKLAVEEAVVNVMDYAYPTGTKGSITVTAKADERRLKFVITDSGAAFDPTEVTSADTSLTAEERPIGGLGILLVRQLMDSINYERIDGHNVLTLIKSLVSSR